MPEQLKGVRAKSIPPTAGIGWRAGLVMECRGPDCPCKRGENVHPPVLMVFDPATREYRKSEARCTARWAATGEGFSAGQICGRRVTHNVADLWLCEQHFKRLREWMVDKGGRVTDVLLRQARELESLEVARTRERHREELRQERLRARARVLAEEAARAESSLVYYLQRTDGLIKIGTTRNLADRLGKLSGKYGELQVLATHGGDHKHEHAMHAQFKDLLAEGREWFRAGLPLVEHIASIRGSAHKAGLPEVPGCVSRSALNGILNRARAAARDAAA